MDAARLTQRHQEALSIAEHCAEVLQKQFGAKQVIPFGSLVGDGPWHETSDLDLAIEGLSHWIATYQQGNSGIGLYFTKWGNGGRPAHPCFLKTCYRTQTNTAVFAIGFATFTDTNWKQRG